MGFRQRAIHTPLTHLLLLRSSCVVGVSTVGYVDQSELIQSRNMPSAHILCGRPLTSPLTL